MEGQQQFCLRWHNFQNTLLSSLPKLLDGGYLTDVTLSAGGRHIRAHRIILSACSYYFKELFKDLNSQQHPVIVLPGMEYANLCALVTFMYNGEVNIYQEQLPSLLAMADTLRIRGLADITGKESKHSNGLFVHTPAVTREKDISGVALQKETKDVTTIPETFEPVSAMHLTDNPDEESSNDQEDAPCSVKTKPYYSINAKLNQKERKFSPSNVMPNTSTDKAYGNIGMDEVTNTTATADEQNPLVETKPLAALDSDNANFGFLTTSATNRTSQACNKTSVTCLICGKQLSNQYNLRVHMETHSNSSYSCTACSHVSRSRDALRKHVSYRHPVAFPQKRPRCSSSKP